MSLNQILEQSLALTKEYLTNFVEQPDLNHDFLRIFGNSFAHAQGLSLLQALIESNFNQIPQIEIVSSQAINQAHGAYAFQNDTIYLAQEFLNNNSDNLDAVAGVLIAEIGHYLDWHANLKDAPGDEGDIFAAVVTGRDLALNQLQLLQQQDDRTRVEIPGKNLTIEQAGIIYVDLNATGQNNGSSWTNAYTSLTDAIAIAQLGDQIWVAKGTYYPTMGVDRNLSFKFANGVKLYGGFAGDETELTQRDYLTHPTILSGDIGTINDNSDNSYHVVDVSNISNNSVLDGFFISGGNADLNTVNYGGGIYSNLSKAVLANLTIQDNIASYGGGIYSEQSQLYIDNVVLKGNFASLDGGGLYNSNSNSILQQVVFQNNYASDRGGGIYNYQSDPLLTEVEFRSNQASEGGAIYNYQSDPNIIKPLFLNNTTVDNGGAIFNSYQSSPKVENGIFKGNIANISGGSIYNNGATVDASVTNSLFTKNISQFGGVFYNDNNALNLTNTTIVDNLGRYGAAIESEGNQDTTRKIANSIIWHNPSILGNKSIADLGEDTKIDYSLIEGGYSGIDNLTEKPLFVDANQLDFRLSANSPALDRGNKELINQYLPDLAGNPRIANDLVDLGAYEGIKLPPQPKINSDPTIIYVNANATGNNDGTSWRNAYTSLADAIANAPDSQIWVAAGTYQPSQNDPQANFQLKNDVAIYGGFAGNETQLNQRDWQTNSTILSGEIGDPNDLNDNSYHVVNGSHTTNSAVLDGFTITAGNADNLGGGIYNEQSQAIFANLKVHNNHALDGGGLYSSDSLNQLYNVDFANNSAENDGGAIYSDRSALIISSCSFNQNHAEGDGGGLFNFNSNPVLTKVYFSNNTAADQGGAILNDYQSNSSVFNSVFYGNAALQAGGAIFNRGTTVDAKYFNTIFDSNHSPTGGAIYNYYNNSSGINDTFVNNQAATGAAVYTEGDEKTESTFSNSIFWNVEPINAALIANKNANTVVNYSLVQDGYPGLENLDSDPLFVNAEVGDFHLNADSPGVDRGNNKFVTSQIDLDGNYRIVNRIVDLGAYEYTSSAATTPNLLDFEEEQNNFNFGVDSTVPLLI